VYLLVFIQNLLVHLAEKILLMQPLTFGGDYLLTEADWRLFVTLIRFDPVYHLHFKCNRRRIVDYPVLWAFTRELYQWPGVAETVNFKHIVRHYHYSHETINPNRIIPINPVIDYDVPHGRDGI
jgi:putative glutathione S-transferase